MTTLKYIFFIFLIILVSLFASKNMHTVEINFFDGFSADAVKVPAMVLISGSFGFGFFMVWCFELLNRFKLKTQLRIKERKIKLLEDELVKLKQPSKQKPLSSTPVSLLDT